MSPRAGSLQSRVLEAIRAAGEGGIRVVTIRDQLGLDGPNDYPRISNACRDLARTGRVKKVAAATFEYVGEPKDLNYTTSQRRMVRVIRIRSKRREPFTVRRLSELAGCTLDWAQRYAKFLREKGFIEKAGMVTVGCTRAPVYLAVDEKLNDEWPALRRQKKTRAVDNDVAKLREMAFRIGRELKADKESLKFYAGYTEAMLDAINSILRKM